ncbi:MAG: hypothetical protein E4H26_07570 [Flavobacteriales bacterium]|nr:MAG: hypothetical protein E4H26_07570 [Flavobacteriales bacterium]
MQRILLFGWVFVTFVSCRPEPKETASNDIASFEIETADWAKKVAINSKAQALIENWTEFKSLEASFDALFTVVNREDLSLVIEDLIEKQKVLEASAYPQEFDKPQIKGRQKMFKTFILKVKGDLYYRLDVQPAVKEMISAYNAFRNQFNIMVNNTLDTKLILEQ